MTCIERFLPVEGPLIGEYGISGWVTYFYPSCFMYIFRAGQTGPLAGCRLDIVRGQVDRSFFGEVKRPGHEQGGVVDLRLSCMFKSRFHQ